MACLIICGAYLILAAMFGWEALTLPRGAAPELSPRLLNLSAGYLCFGWPAMFLSGPAEHGSRVAWLAIWIYLAGAVVLMGRLCWRSRTKAKDPASPHRF